MNKSKKIVLFVVTYVCLMVLFGFAFEAVVAALGITVLSYLMLVSMFVCGVIVTKLFTEWVAE